MIGTTLTLPGALGAELTGQPFDFVWVDLEHGALGPAEAQELILGAQAAGARALVRVSAEAERLAAAMLDAGADGVVIADVEDTATVDRFAAALTHPPAGSRGWGPRRSAWRGRGAAAGPQPTLWVQIESAAGVAAAPALAAHAAVDALVVGTSDLSVALGAPLDLTAPEVGEAIAAIAAAARAAGTELGLAGALDRAPTALLTGVSILVHSTDARLAAEAADAAAELMGRLLDPTRQGVSA